MGETMNSIGEAASQAANDIFFDRTTSFFCWIMGFLTWKNLFRLVGSIFIIFLIWLAFRIISKAIRRVPETKLPAQRAAIVIKFVHYIFYIVIALYVLGLFGVNLKAIWGAAGIAGVAIGFAAQTSVSNLISGLFVLTEGSIHVGDTIIRQLSELGQIQDGDFHSGKKTFVYTGSIRKVNNLSLLVDAAKLLAQRGNQQALLLIYGDGNEREALEQRVAQEKLENIRFKGRVPKTDIPAILSQADFTVLHNTSTILDKYGQSQNKFFEYLAAGKPILMTYSVGHSVIRQEQCGIELECQTAETIADAIDEMCALDSKIYERCCENALRCAEKFDFKVLTQQMIEVVENLP